MRARLGGLLIKELIQFFRDRVLLILILWLYTVEVVICAYALTFDVKNLPLTVADLDRSPASRELTERFLVSDAFALARYAASEEEAAGFLRSGAARMALVIPADFQERLQRDATPVVQVILDGTNSNTAALARTYALQIIDLFDRVWPSGTAGRGPMVEPATRVWYNPDETFTPFVVLSMIALAALMVGVIHPAASIVREKEIGTIEQLMVTPIRTGELFLAKTAPTLAMGLLSVFPSLLIVWWFGVPLRGSLLLFLGLTALFLVSAIAIGVFVSAISRTLQQALLLSFFGLFPVMFISGTLAPIESMPAFLQNLSQLSPLTHYMEVILGIFLKGAGFAELWPHALALLAIGLPLFGLALVAFRRTLT
jgi:ABC-2 type transport system permease protein